MSKTTYEIRPTVFRAWDHHKMVDVQSLCWNAGGILWYGAGNQFGWAWVNPVCDSWNKDNPKPSDADICPIMQWTGLKDINGKDIWEGDVVEFEYEIGEDDWDKSQGEVFFQNGAFFFGREYEWATNDANFNTETMRVVGNVFENPELPR